MVVGALEDTLRADGTLNHVTEFDETREEKGDERNIEGKKVAGESLMGLGRSKQLMS